MSLLKPKRFNVKEGWGGGHGRSTETYCLNWREIRDESEKKVLRDLKTRGQYLADFLTSL